MNRNRVRVLAEGILIVMTAALTYMERTTIGACLFLTFLLLSLEVSERKIHNRVVRNILTTLFVAYMSGC